MTIQGNGLFRLLNCTASQGTLTLKNLTLEGGYVSGNGGGLLCTSGLIALNCSFINNTANSGGGLRVSGAVTLTNCSFSGNEAASQYGGGLYASSTATLTDCTFAGNTASVDGGGMYSGGAATLRQRNPDRPKLPDD